MADSDDETTEVGDFVTVVSSSSSTERLSGLQRVRTGVDAPSGGGGDNPVPAGPAAAAVFRLPLRLGECKL